MSPNIWVSIALVNCFRRRLPTRWRWSTRNLPPQYINNTSSSNVAGIMSDDNLHVSTDRAEMPVSILDTDLYKVSLVSRRWRELSADLAQLTMQNAVLRWFQDAWVKIRFTNRSPQMLFTRQSFDWIQERVNRKTAAPSRADF